MIEIPVALFIVLMTLGGWLLPTLLGNYIVSLVVLRMHHKAKNRRRK